MGPVMELLQKHAFTSAASEMLLKNKLLLLADKRFVDCS